MAIVQLLTEFGLKEQPRKIEYFWVLQDTLIAAYALESRSQLAGEILNQFFAFYPHLEEKPFFQAYRDRSLVLGREVTVLERGQTRTALALDLNPDFSLQVREADGRERALASGEVGVKL